MDWGYQTWNSSLSDQWTEYDIPSRKQLTRQEHPEGDHMKEHSPGYNRACLGEPHQEEQTNRDVYEEKRRKYQISGL